MFGGVLRTDDCECKNRAGNVRESSSIGAMDERARKVQKASSHVACCVAADGAGVECDVAIADVDAAALHPEKGTSIQRGDAVKGPGEFRRGEHSQLLGSR